MVLACEDAFSELRRLAAKVSSCATTTLRTTQPGWRQSWPATAPQHNANDSSHIGNERRTGAHLCLSGHTSGGQCRSR
ncbi:hypothetical protein ACLKA7_002063 [Drosophila subpalustris]